MNKEEASKTMCDCCAKEQEELYETNVGGCGQIICTHMMHENEEVVEPIRTKKRKHDANEEVFPTATEMVQSTVISFSNLMGKFFKSLKRKRRRKSLMKKRTNVHI